MGPDEARTGQKNTAYRTLGAAGERPEALYHLRIGLSAWSFGVIGLAEGKALCPGEGKPAPFFVFVM